MKKILVLSFIIFLGLVTHAQDLDFSNPDFSTYLPTGWSQIDDSASTGTTKNWQKTNYAVVMGDGTNLQSEWLISPSITSTVGYNYQLNFYYKVENYSLNNNVYVLISPDNGTTWLPTLDYEVDAAWKLNNGIPSNYTWHTITALNIDGFITAGNLFKIAFVYRTPTNPSTTNFALDNIVVEEDDNLGGGFMPHVTKNFEAGLNNGGWVTLNDNDGNGSTQFWSNHYIAGVFGDNLQNQDEWLVSEELIIPDNALTTPYVEMDWFALDYNDASEGGQLLITNDDGANWILLNSDPYNNTWNNYVYTENVNIAAYKGNTVKFAIRVQEIADATPGSFFLERFHVYQTFNKGAVAVDANVTLAALDTMVFPLAELYDNNTGDATGKAEGFWQVAPHNWTQTNTSGATWGRAGSIGNHDYSAYIDTVGANEASMNESLTSDVIAINYPSVGASYLLSFQWRTQTNLNAGTNTNPLLGSGVNYDFADIMVEISINGGAFTKIWQEDDEALLDSTTSGTGNSYQTAWSSFQNYLANPGNWYKAELDLNAYISETTTSLQIRINYVGNGAEAGYFNIDNLYVLQSKQPEFNLEAAQPFSVNNNFLANYTLIPITQLDNPYLLGAVLTNNGVASFTNADLFGYVTDNFGTEQTFGVKSITPALLPAYTTQYITFDEAVNRNDAFTEGISFESGHNYALRYQVANLNGSAFNESVSFNVSNTQFMKFGSGVDGYVTTDDISGGIGTLFEFKKADVIDNVSVYLGDVTNSSDFNLTVIKIASPTANSGTVVYTSPLMRMSYDYYNYAFNDDLTLDAGYYIFMFNQLDNNNLYIAYDDDTYTDGVIYRGNASSLYTYEGEIAELYVTLNVKANIAPVISSAIAANSEKVWIAGVNDSLIFEATDANNDSLFWSLDAANPVWLTDWITFTDNTDGTATLKGTPTTNHLGTSNITVSVTDNRGSVVSRSFKIKVASQEAAYTPDYTEVFTGTDGTVPNNWVAINDKLETGSDYHWNIASNYMNIYGDWDENQDEWIISPPIYLPNSSKSLDTTYRLEFSWSVANFNYFCLGIPGVLGSAGNGGYNYADVTLLISTDNGKTWSAPIWKEDDSELVAPVTAGIDGGGKWGYNSGQLYTSKIDLSAYANQTLLFAFRYQGKSADYSNNRFYFDNFKVLMNKQIDISVFTYRDFEYLPERQVDQVNGVKFYAYIINQGISVPDNATYSLKLPEVGYDETFDLDAAFFASGDTQVIEYTYFPQANINQWYYFTTKVTASGNATSGLTSNTESTNIHQNLMRKKVGTNLEEKSFGYYDGLGVGYELVNADHLYYIDGYFGPTTAASTPISISVIKVNDFNDPSGELIMTIDDNNGTPLTTGSGYYSFFPSNDKDITGNPYLQPGKYIIMFNQLDANKPLYIYKTNTSYHFNEYFRGNFSNIYKDGYDKGHLYASISFDSNDAPRFVNVNGTTITTFEAEVLQGQTETYEIFAADNDEFDVFGFEQVTNPSFLAPAWLSFSFNGDTAFMNIANTATAGEYPAQLRVSDGIDTTTLAITIKIKGPQFMSDEFYEPFNNWTEVYPKVTTANNTWLLAKGDESESTVDWYRPSNYSQIDADWIYKQDEWLISPYVYFTAPSNDTTYWLNFNWLLGDVNRMIGGTTDVLGSGDEFNYYNYADLRLKVSTDGGTNWTLLWQEDNEDLVRAATEDIPYPYNSGTYYTAKINITSLAGQPLLFGFQYEGMQATYVRLDEIEVERVDPYVDLEITDYDVLPYYMPIKQVKNIDVKFSVKNNGTALSTAATIAAQVTNSGGNLNPAYEETMQLAPLAGGASMVYSFPTAHAAYGNYNWNYYFYFDIYTPYNLSKSYTSYVSNTFYGYDQGGPNGSVTSEPGQGLGQVFQIFEEDMMTQIYFYSYSNATFVVNIVKLTDANATNGELIYSSSPIYSNNGWRYLNIEDVVLETGYYAVFVSSSEDTQTIQIGYNSFGGDNPGTYIKGDADSFEVVEQSRYLNFRLVFDNSAPYFANSAGNSISLTDEKANVGIEFTKIIRAIDEDEDDVAVVEGLVLPTWLSIELVNGLYTLKGTPTINDIGENLVVLRAVDGTTYDEEDFTITVEANPAPTFITSPVTYAFEGNIYSYTATASDMFEDDVTLSVTLPVTPSNFLSQTGAGNTLTISGTPTANDAGNYIVKILATDENGMTAQQIFNLQVEVNETPVFVTVAPTNGYVGSAYRYLIATTDGNNNDIVSITAPTLPAWLSLTPNGNGRAILSGTPTAKGNFNVVLTASDAAGATANQSFTILVDGNTAPSITSTAITAATEDVLYVYNIIATDSDEDNLYFVEEVMPNWLVLTVNGNGTAKLHGIPTQEYVGNNQVSIKVGDGSATALQSFTIAVAEVNDAPEIIAPVVNEAMVGNEFRYAFEGFDEEGATLEYTAELPEWLTLEPTFDGKATIQGIPANEHIGDHLIKIMVSDGNSVAEQDFTLTVINLVGAQEFEEGILTIYPNPTQGSFSITNVKDATIMVYNATGALIKKVDNAALKETINLSSFNTGTYIVKVVTDKNVITRPINLIK